MALHSLKAEDVLYQDDDLLVLNKPAGVPVHGSQILEGRPVTLLGMARDYTGCMVHAVHRLDRPVSGAILMTFNKEVLAGLSTAFEHRQVDKRYLAVVRGWSPERGTIDHPLLPPRDERKGKEEAREAVTSYERLATAELAIEVPPYPAARYSLLELVPATGRRHQLRRHMKHISHHLVGDTSYGRGEHNRLFREHFGCKRLLLHSRSLTFCHPQTKETLVVAAPLDESFKRVVKIFGWPTEAGPSGDKPEKPFGARKV